MKSDIQNEGGAIARSAEPKNPIPSGLRARAAGFAEIFDRSTAGMTTPLNIVIDEVQGPVRAIIEGRATLMFGTNSYLGLNFDESCIAAATESLQRYGAGSTASRVASGNQRLHVRLEEAVASFYGRRDAVIFSTGFMANLGTICALVREGDAVALDAHCHASIFDACKLSGAKIMPFRHNDAADLASILAASGIAPTRTLVIVEGVYSVLGDVAQLRPLVDVAKSYGAMVMVDEAHSLGLHGPLGRGVAEEQDVEQDVDVIVGTFSKSVGVIGGYCTTNDPAFRAMRFAARAYLYTASLPPAVVAAAYQAIQLIRRDGGRREAVWRNANIMHAGLVAQGLVPCAPPGPVGALRMPGIRAGLGMWRALLQQGVYVNMLIPPSTPGGDVVLRYSVSAAHEDSHIDAALAAFGNAARTIGLI